MNELGELYDLLDEVSPKQRDASRVFRLLVLNGVSNIDILASWDTDKLNEFAKNTKYIGKERRKILEDAVLKAKVKVYIDNIKPAMKKLAVETFL